ncbi:hypothetical protein BDV25DRAFT_150003 [Aspergillus avenaceus]|uniref:Uncharacterized protein n=1 Tax=Aspergillus avenaceus TaxID=36643 RepID=A0A5N6U3F6_ASPAV|nr:hypothetical protein BDV25DRAFT_150003 [Aspergillus avenaceus]
MIPIKPFSLLDTVTILSILMTVGLLVMAGVINDGVALVGVGTMALSTCTASFSAWWRPKLVKRQVKSKVPGGSIVIKTRGGGFIVVKGDESVIRELYTGMDACDYIIKDVKRQWLLAASTLFLMISVIMFSNSSQRMQIAIGAAYFILNILYWLLALLVPPHNIWDMSRYRVQREEYEFHGNTLTDALWVAIQYTGQTEWVTRSHIMPNTRFWNQWLQEAQEALDKNPRAWDAGEGRNKLMNEAKEECERMPMPASKIFQDREDENEDEEDRSRPAKMKGGEVLLDGRK